jgi:hypothetical protein
VKWEWFSLQALSFRCLVSIKKMLSGDILSQVYLASAILGVGFIVFNFITGQLGDGGGDDGGAAGAGGHDFGASDGGGAGGHDFGASDSGGGGHDFGASDNGGGQGAGDHNSGFDSVRLHQVMASSASRMIVPGSENVRSQLGRMLLGLLSPMGIAISLAFFGLAGLVLLHNLPFLGWLTLIPAVLFSLAISNAFKSAIRWMAKSMEVSSESKVAELIGQVAEVNIPFKDGCTGEVTYVVQSKRYNAAARPFKPGTIFARGSKVMIVDIKEDHTLLVEPYADVLL